MAADRRHEQMTGRIVPRHENDDNEKFQTGASVARASAAQDVTTKPQSAGEEAGCSTQGVSMASVKMDAALKSFIIECISEAQRESNRRIKELEEKVIKSKAVMDSQKTLITSLQKRLDDAKLGSHTPNQFYALERNVAHNEKTIEELRAENKSLRTLVTNAENKMLRKAGDLQAIKEEVETGVQSGFEQLRVSKEEVDQSVQDFRTILPSLVEAESKAVAYNASMGALQSDVRRLSCSIQDLPSLQQRMDKAEQKSRTDESVCRSSNTFLASKIAEVRDSISKTEGKLDDIDAHIQGLETKMTGIEGKVGGMNGRINGLNTKVGRIDSDLGNNLQYVQSWRWFGAMAQAMAGSAPPAPSWS